MSLRNIGKSIRERRKELNVNQRTVADLSGVAVNTLLAVERGEGNPQLSSLIAILNTLGLQIDITVKQLNDETV